MSPSSSASARAPAPPTAFPNAVASDREWFEKELAPHEPLLRNYLRGKFPGVRDLDDVVQESYLRVYRTKAQKPIESVKGFLFLIAKRLALDALRRNKTATDERVTDFDPNRVIEDAEGVPETISKRQEIRLLAEAIHALPPRCRDIMILRKLEGLSHKEICARLSINEATVETQVRRGIAKCSEYLAARGVVIPPRAPRHD